MSDAYHFCEQEVVALLLRHMKIGSQTDLLQLLRATLQHFDQSPDYGDTESVGRIRQHLIARIREAESSIRCAERQQPYSYRKTSLLHSEAQAEAA